MEHRIFIYSIIHNSFVLTGLIKLLTFNFWAKVVQQLLKGKGNATVLILNKKGKKKIFQIVIKSIDWLNELVTAIYIRLKLQIWCNF